MTDPIATLHGEHRLIESVLSALEALSARVRAGEAVDGEELRAFVRFFRQFADGCHHGKEEDILFAAMVEEAGMPMDMGPIAVMLDEHEQGRRAVAEMSELAEQEALSPDDSSRLSQIIASYSAMLRQHILKEDGVLYPMAQARLSQAVIDEIARQFARADAALPRGEDVDSLRSLAASLIARGSDRPVNGAR